MKLPQRPYVFKSKVLKRVCYAFQVILLLAWFAFVGLVMSWSGYRPLTPKPETGQVIPYMNHGLMFVTQRDVDTSHALLAVAFASGFLAAGCYFADRRLWRRKIGD